MMIIFEAVQIAQNHLPNCPLTLFPRGICLLHSYVHVCVCGFRFPYNVWNYVKSWLPWFSFSGVIFNNLRMVSAYFIAFGAYSLCFCTFIIFLCLPSQCSYLKCFPVLQQWLLASYNNQILLMLFLAIVSLLLSGFFGYHAHLCLTNTTTNEVYFAYPEFC